MSPLAPVPGLLLLAWLLRNTSVIKRDRMYFSLLTTSLGSPRLDQRYSNSRFTLCQCQQNKISIYLSHCLSGVCPLGSYPFCCGLPAYLGHWHGHNAGENYHHQEGLNHLSASEMIMDVTHLSTFLVLLIIPTKNCKFYYRPSMCLLTI